MWTLRLECVLFTLASAKLQQAVGGSSPGPPFPSAEFSIFDKHEVETTLGIHATTQ